MSKITLTENTIAPNAPATGAVSIYGKTDGHLYQMRDNGKERSLTFPFTLLPPNTVYSADTWTDVETPGPHVWDINDTINNINNGVSGYPSLAPGSAPLDPVGDWVIARGVFGEGSGVQAVTIFFTDGATSPTNVYPTMHVDVDEENIIVPTLILPVFDGKIWLQFDFGSNPTPTVSVELILMATA